MSLSGARSASSTTRNDNVDVFLPDNPPNPGLWNSNIQLFVTCGTINNRLGPVSLARGFVGGFNSFEFAIPNDVRQAGFIQ
jgi:hypothetical protein